MNAATNEFETTGGKIVRIRKAIEESRSGLDELKSRLKNEALEEMGTITAELAEVEQSLVRSRDRVERLRIRSPVRGLVKDLKTKTLGGVVAPGGAITEIVPVDRELEVEARISPIDVGHVKIGQAAKVKVTTFDFARFGNIEGTVRSISATTFEDPDGVVYYKAQVKLARNYVGEDPTANILLPGMVTEIDFNTGERTLLRYLLRPVYRSLDAALTER